MIRLLLVAFLLSGCSAATRAYVEEGTKVIQDTEDQKAKTLVKALCAITVGAKNRVLSFEQRGHVEALCGGAPPIKGTP